MADGSRTRSRKRVGSTRYDGFGSRFLTADERAELLLYWGGYASVVGFGSVHSAVQAQLMRSPPRDGQARTAIVEVLSSRREALLDRLVEVVHLDHGFTRFEVRRSLGGLVADGTVQAFATYEDGEDANGNPVEGLRRDRVKLVSVPRWAPPPALTPEERWRREDDRLRSYCIGGPVPATPHAAPHVDRGGEGAARTLTVVDYVGEALARLVAPERQALERAYGSRTTTLEDEVSKVIPLTLSAADLRSRVALQRAATMLGSEAHPELPVVASRVARTMTASEAIVELFDRSPAEKAERDRLKAQRDEFLRAARKEAEGLLERSCRSYREAKSS